MTVLKGRCLSDSASRLQLLNYPLTTHQVRTHYSFLGCAVLACLFFRETCWKSIAAGFKPTLAYARNEDCHLSIEPAHSNLQLFFIT